MTTGNNNGVFTTGSIMRHVSVTSFTASIGLMAIYAVDLVDLIFISMLGYEVLAAAAGYASALMFFTSAINIGVSVAAGVLASRTIGAGKMEEAQEYATSAAIFSALLSIVISLVLLSNIEFFLGLLGATGDVADLAATYLWIIIPFTWVSGLSMVSVAVLRGYGENRRAMYPSLFGALTNAVLDPILIFGLDMGMEGAAWATVAARFMTLGFALYPAMRRHNAFIPPKTWWLWRDLRTVSHLATRALLANVASPIGTAIVTREMSKFGPEAIAGMAVIGRLTPVAFSVIWALSGAIGPIIGQNFGAGYMDRVKKAYIDALKFVAIYVMFITMILLVFRGPIAGLFGAENLTKTLIFLFCFPLALASFFNGAIFVASASFNTLGRPSYSTWLSWGQNTLGTWPFVVVGGMILGAPGVLIGQAIGSVVFASMAIWLGWRLIHNPPDDRGLSRHHPPLFGHGSIVAHTLHKHVGQ
ncbi:MATE family efflux transporter [Roseovarius ramblicola]|uniref:Multidrug-efflux transporter n=1 Tax=Roseovarius ramblicola TaxID=2022336 RepID=A0ABV5HX05_9RHOB